MNNDANFVKNLPNYVAKRTKRIFQTTTKVQIDLLHDAFKYLEDSGLIKPLSPISLPVSGDPDGSPYIERIGDSYAVAFVFEFPGSDEYTDPDEIRAIVHHDGVGTTMDIRVYDLTNSLVVAELTGITAVVPTSVSLGTVSNVPTGRAVWEVHIKTDNVGGSARVGYVSVEPVV